MSKIILIIIALHVGWFVGDILGDYFGEWDFNEDVPIISQVFEKN